MAREERIGFMAEVVVPEMTALMRQQDPRAKPVECETCHGKSMATVDFRMPNGLLPLAPRDIAARLRAGDPPSVFMAKHVVPRMADLLGRKLWSPSDPSGFGCHSCHDKPTTGLP